MVIFLLTANIARCEEKISFEKIREYLDRPYVGMNYHDALRADRPFALVFADPKDIFSILRFAPAGEMLVKEFDGKYNAAILSVKDDYNKRLAEAFHAKRLPALYLIDTKTQTYMAVNSRDYTPNKLRIILNDYLSECSSEED
jgi:hypothetical protein